MSVRPSIIHSRLPFWRVTICQLHFYLFSSLYSLYIPYITKLTKITLLDSLHYETIENTKLVLGFRKQIPSLSFKICLNSRLCRHRHDQPQGTAVHWPRGWVNCVCCTAAAQYWRERRLYMARLPDCRLGQRTYTPNDIKLNLLKSEIRE